MRKGIGAAGALLVAAIVLGLLAMLYRAHRAERGEEASRDEPVVAPSRLERSDDAVLVALDSAAASRIGLQVAPLAAARNTNRERLAGLVVPEPERKAVVRAPVTGRLSVPGRARWPVLGEQVTSGRPLARVSDALPLTAPVSGTVTRIGTQPGAIVQAGEELLEIVDLRQPLVRVVWSTPAVATPSPSVLLEPGPEAPTVPARLVGPSPEADPATGHAAYLYRASRAWPGSVPGTAVTALVPSASSANTGKAAALVPDSAVVQWDGLAWAYLRRAPGSFERVRVPTDRPVPGGWLVRSGLSVGDTVVITGAQELLSEEFRARVTVGDESGE